MITSKKILLILIIILLPLSAKAEVVGSIYSTDIVGFIDHLAVPTYNIGGSTVVIVRDLECYGFTVSYDDSTRTATIYRDRTVFPWPLPPTYNPHPVGTRIADLSSTDIKAFYNGNLVQSYNIEGRTAILLRDLNLVGDVYFDEEKRQVDIITDDLEYFDDELIYSRDIVYNYLMTLSELDCRQDEVLNSINAGALDEDALEKFQDFLKAATEAFAYYKDDYKEPYGFKESSNDLWWAMVNCRLASESIVSYCAAPSEALMKRIDRYRLDSLKQRRSALDSLREELWALAYMWD